MSNIVPQNGLEPAMVGERGIIPIIANNSFLPVLSMQEAQSRINALKQFVRDQLVKDVDYGTIPGTSDKPVLLKPGAEKLCTFFGLRSQFAVVECKQDWQGGIFYYWYKCRLFRGDMCIAEGDGSSNSYEKKYRWRQVYEDKATDRDRETGRREIKYGRNGRSYTVFIVENDDPYSLINTLQKMAQKRALIAATLIGVNASEFFTQDLEDVVDVETTDAAPLGEQGPPFDPDPPKEHAQAPAPAGPIQMPQAKSKPASAAPASAGPPVDSGNWTQIKIIEFDPRILDTKHGKREKWGIKGSDGKWYGTWDKDDAATLQAAKAQGRAVWISFTVDGKYNTIVKGGVRS